MEQFAIPGAGGIIVKAIDGVNNTLTQIRVKPDAPCENGPIEKPAGKVQAFGSIFDTLKKKAVISYHYLFYS